MTLVVTLHDIHWRKRVPLSEKVFRKRYIYYIHIAFYILRHIDSKNLINSCTCTVVKVMTDINFCSKEIVICWIKMYICQNLLREKNNQTRNSFDIHRDFRVWELWAFRSYHITSKIEPASFTQCEWDWARGQPRKFYGVNPTKMNFLKPLKKKHMPSKWSLVDGLPVSANDRKHIKVDLARWWYYQRNTNFCDSTSLYVFSKWIVCLPSCRVIQIQNQYLVACWGTGCYGKLLSYQGNACKIV